MKLSNYQKLNIYLYNYQAETATWKKQLWQLLKFLQILASF